MVRILNINAVCRAVRPTERERTERLIKTRLREIMMQKDLENVTSKEVCANTLPSTCVDTKMCYVQHHPKKTPIKTNTDQP